MSASDQIQLVWDRGWAGTAQSQAGCSIRVGSTGEWTPEELLLAAAESSLMAAFLGLADQAGVEVLGYVSAAELTLATDAAARTSIVVRPCIVIGREQDREPVERLLRNAVDQSPVARALRDALRTDPEVIVVASVGGT